VVTVGVYYDARVVMELSLELSLVAVAGGDVDDVEAVVGSYEVSSSLRYCCCLVQLLR